VSYSLSELGEESLVIGSGDSGGTVDVGDTERLGGLGGGVNSLETSEGVSSGRVGLVDESVNGSLGRVDGGGSEGGVLTTSVGVSNHLLDSVLGTVSDGDGESLLVVLNTLLTVIDGSLGGFDGDGGSGLGRVVETGHVQRVSRPHVGVELNEVGVVTLGELPDEVLRNGHLYRLKVLRFAVRATEVVRDIKTKGISIVDKLKHG
jgi:hypothetical protein